MVGKYGLVALGCVIAATAWYSETIASEESGDGKVHITYWEKWSGFEGEAIREIVNDFNASQDKIYVRLLSISGIDQKTLMAASAGVPPDVAGLYGPNVPQYADDGAVMPLEEFCKEGGINAEQFVKAYWDVGVYGGHVWALPTTPATTALHVNTKLLREAGFDKPPVTIEEMGEMAKKITKREKGGKLSITGFLPGEPGWWNWSWSQFFGGKLWDGKGKITCNDEGSIKAMEWIKSYSKLYGVQSINSFRSGFGGFGSPQNPFMSGTIAMEIQGVWMANFITKFAPKLEWDAVPFPYPKDRPDLANTTHIDMDVLVIPRGAKHPKEAFEFIKYVVSQPAMEKLCRLHGKHSPLSKVSDDFYRTHPNKRIKLFYDLASSPNATPPPKIGIWNEFSSELGAGIDKVTLLSATPKEAMDYVVARMQPRLDQYLKRREQRRKLGL